MVDYKSDYEMMNDYRNPLPSEDDASYEFVDGIRRAYVEGWIDNRGFGISKTIGFLYENGVDEKIIREYTDFIIRDNPIRTQEYIDFLKNIEKQVNTLVKAQNK